MEQDHPKHAAFDVWQMADLSGRDRRLGDRGYRWAQLEAGIRAGRLQIGAFMHGWGAAASTFYDEEVSKLLGTEDLSPLLMVAIGPRAAPRPLTPPPWVGRVVPPATRGERNRAATPRSSHEAAPEASEFSAA